jgi:ABC-2 type transport system ATP-binding protein
VITIAMLSVESIGKSFGSIRALTNLSFSVEAGEIVGFVGRNGSGKTTTMRSILGLVEIDAGRVLFNGRNKSHSDNSSIGYMPEERGLYAKSKVSEQLQYFAELQSVSAHDAKASVKDLLERFDVSHFADRVLSTLSLGNQQRIQFIAALVHRPQLLLLDEPFNGLDPVAMSQLTTILREMTSEGAAVLFSSHQLDLVSHLCDRIVIIDSGKVIAEDSLSNLQIREKIEYLVTGQSLPQDLTSEFPEIISYISPTVAKAVFHRSNFASEKNRLLNSILERGSLESFTEVKPSLSEIYRELVAHE